MNLVRVQTLGRRLLEHLCGAALHVWAMVLPLALVLSLLRMGQIRWHWPAGLLPVWDDLGLVLLQGLRFDLKVSAAAAALTLLLLGCLPARWLGRWLGLVAVLFVLASLINLHYFGFYKMPIDATVFGFFEDDTGAILQTVWNDFPVVATLLTLWLASWGAIVARRRLYRSAQRWLVARQRPAWALLLGLLLAGLLLALSIKGTLRAMALERQNVSVTTSQFLNDMVPNGVIALQFAWDSRRDSQNFSDPLLGLKRLGYASPMAAAQALGLPVSDEAALKRLLLSNPDPAPAPASTTGQRKNLLFFLMESWSAEPLLYHDAKAFDVLGRLEPTLGQACHFSNFDSAQPGTHPSLEALLFSTPITPLTLGPHGRTPIPWSIPLLLKQAGYRTLFVSSVRSGWRDLDRVLKTQGFDEVVDANQLKALYPEAELGIWGVWDSYVFRYLEQRLSQAPSGPPLFVFVLTATNHPPYDLPADYQRRPRDPARWRGELGSDTLWANLDTYHYATDLLGGFVQQLQASPWRDNTIVAATGDHNVRSFGVYASAERRYLMGQVPFVLWAPGQDCGPQRQAPAGHRDIFPTLMPLLGIQQGYLLTGRNLLLDPAKARYPQMNAPLSVNYYDAARSDQGRWIIRDPASFVCSRPQAEGSASSAQSVRSANSTDCRFDPQQDALARAQLGLQDWMVRTNH